MATNGKDRRVLEVAITVATWKTSGLVYISISTSGIMNENLVTFTYNTNAKFNLRFI